MFQVFNQVPQGGYSQESPIVYVTHDMTYRVKSKLLSIYEVKVFLDVLLEVKQA